MYYNQSKAAFILTRVRVWISLYGFILNTSLHCVLLTCSLLHCVPRDNFCYLGRTKNPDDESDDDDDSNSSRSH